MNDFPVDNETLRVLCDYSLELVKLRLEYCNHLCTENNGPETLHKVLGAYESKCDWFSPTIIVNDTRSKALDKLAEMDAPFIGDE